MRDMEKLENMISGLRAGNCNTHKIKYPQTPGPTHKLRVQPTHPWVRLGLARMGTHG